MPTYDKEIDMSRKIQSPFELEKREVKVLNEKARQLQRSKSSIIRQLIREYLPKIGKVSEQ
jgi:hypothetical protein